MPIPSHTRDGLLPPFTGSDPTSHGRVSPYEATMVEVVSRFATTEVRARLLRGLLSYRAELRAFGLADGFQWIDGSFVELTKGEPGDIDLVTFASRPDSYDPGGRWLFDRDQTKKRFGCDVFFVNLRQRHPSKLVERTAEYCALFSHRKQTTLWKGMLQVDLMAIDADDEAGRLLVRLGIERSTP